MTTSIARNNSKTSKISSGPTKEGKSKRQEDDDDSHWDEDAFWASFGTPKRALMFFF